MYQNIYVERGNKGTIVHLWDDVKGYFTVPYKRYAYKKSSSGKYVSMYGDKLEKITNFDPDEEGLFESDVLPETRTLIDLYGDSDDISGNHIVLNLDIEVSMVGSLPNPSTATNEITAISFHNQSKNQFYVLVLDKNKIIEKELSKDNVIIVTFQTEKELLEYFISKYIEICPTIVTGWNILDFDIPYLYNRLKNVLGKDIADLLSPIQKVHFNKTRNKYIISGVSCLDYLILYKKFNYSVEPSYRLDAIGKKEVGMGKIEYTGTLDDLLREDIETFIKYSLTDVKIVDAIDDKLKLIDLCRSVCHVGHVPYEDIWYSSRYLEGALLVYLRRNGNLIAPSKIKNDEPYDEDAEEGFIGAYVKEPVPGRYDWVFSCDVNSLYPSAIRTLNISPETKRGKILNWVHKNKNIKGFSFIPDDEILDYEFDGEVNKLTKSEFIEMMNSKNYSISGNGIIYDMNIEGIIPAVLTKWFAERKEFQALMKKYSDEGDKVKQSFYKRRQHVQKILLNSLYGTLGLRIFRFYDVDNAEATTITGQIIIRNTEEFIHNQYNKLLIEKGAEPLKDNKNVIYSDTDSLRGDSTLRLNNETEITVENLFLLKKDNSVLISDVSNREYIFPNEQLNLPYFDEKNKEVKLGKLQYIERHKVKKVLYKVKTKLGKEVIITGDHSIQILNEESDILEKKLTKDLKKGDKVIII